MGKKKLPVSVPVSKALRIRIIGTTQLHALLQPKCTSGIRVLRQMFKKQSTESSSLFKKDRSGQTGNGNSTVSNRHYPFPADRVSEAYDFKCSWINILADKAQDRVRAGVSATHY